MLSIFLAAALHAPVQTRVAPDDRFTAIRNELVGLVERGDIPSISVAVIDHGKTVWEESIGWADRERDIPATPDTAYRLASLGKSVTATTVLHFVDDGRIRLDSPINQYLGNAKLTIYEGRADDVTVARVLDMTAEIPHGGMSFKSLDDRRTFTAATLVRNRGMVVLPPGTIAMYSNMNYGVVEQMLETVAGEPFASVMQKEFFAPLGMTHSWVGPDKAGGVALYSGDHKLLPAMFDVPESSLSMYMSADDLLRFARLHLAITEPRYLKSETLQLMHTHESGVPNNPFALGIGRMTLDGDEQLLISNGRANGAQSTLLVLPRENSAVICLINQTGSRTDDLAFRIGSVERPHLNDEITSRIAAYEKTMSDKFTVAASDYGVWRGSIVNGTATLPIELEFQPDGDIHVRVAKQPETLVKLSYDDGFITGRFIAQVPTEIEPGHAHPVVLKLYRSGNRLSGYATSDFANERGNFSLPSYISLTKVP